MNLFSRVSAAVVVISFLGTATADVSGERFQRRMYATGAYLKKNYRAIATVGVWIFMVCLCATRGDFDNNALVANAANSSTDAVAMKKEIVAAITKRSTMAGSFLLYFWRDFLQVAKVVSGNFIEISVGAVVMVSFLYWGVLLAPLWFLGNRLFDSENM